jgi:hypothetical protein
MSEQVQHDSTTGEGSEESVFVDQYDWQDEMIGHGMEDISSVTASIFLAVISWIAAVVCIGLVAFELGRVILNG